MTPPPPSNLIVPGEPSPPGPRQVHVYGPDGKILRTVSVGQRSDPGFFKNLVTQVRNHDQPIRLGLAMSGAGAAGGALVVATVLNLGNPFLYRDRRETWKELHGTLKGSAWDVWITYFSEISGNWTGHAVETFQQYLRFKLIGMFDQLGSLAKDMTEAMNSQYKEVHEYDASVGALWATSAPVFKALMAMSGHPVGRVALMTQTGLFLTAAGTLLKQFADVYNTHESTLMDLELKLHEVRGIFYNAGRPGMGARDLSVHPDIEDPRHWRPASEAEPK
ncbi:hypothetical protein [Nonomuraea sp. NPDC050540]|uniref:hypothetical protein n=1 Tax=Nonomuraea sp. NPDC050540 TaxID=3364367 RepID=UPI0037944B86